MSPTKALIVAEKVGKAKLIGIRPAISQASATTATESRRHSQLGPAAGQRGRRAGRAATASR